MTNVAAWVRRQLWWLLAAACCAGLNLLSTLGWTSRHAWFSDLAQLGGALYMASQCARRGWEDPTSRRGWLLLSVAARCWALGEAIWSTYEVVLRREVPFVSWADAAYLSGYVFAGAGLVSLARSRGRRARIADLVDAVLISGSLLAVSWEQVLGPSLVGPSQTALQAVVGWSYPLGDLMLASIALLIMRDSPSSIRRSMALLCTGLLASCFADSAFVALTARDAYQSGSLIDVWWVVGYLLMARAAMTPPSSPRRQREHSSFGEVAALIPYLTLVLSGAVVLLDRVGGRAIPPAEGSLLALLAVAFLVRQALTSHEQTTLARRLASREELFRTLVQGSSDVVALLQPSGDISYHSPATHRVLGYPEDSLLRRNVLELVHPEDAAMLQEEFVGFLDRETRLQDTAAMLECRVRDADGSWRHVEVHLADHRGSRGVGGVVANIRDITDRHELQSHLSRLAYTDALTGLANRSLFINRLDQALAGRREPELSVLYIDLDGFKSVNDSLGHAAGDALLVEATARLGEALRSGDTVARLGGDEFAALLTHTVDAIDARVVAQRVLKALSRPYVVAGREVVITASIGIASAARGSTAEELMRNADLAMYGAKSAGKSGVEVYLPEMHAAVLSRLELEGELRRALMDGGLSVAYQPIVDLSTGQVVAVEALARWQHPTRGLVPPQDFIAVAEDTGLVVPLGRWVLEHATHQVAEWRRQGHRISLAVNVSVRQLQGSGLVAGVRESLATSGLPAHALTLELTESVMADAAGVMDRLHRLHDLGVRLAIDDFGTGFSSLSYLRALPVDEVKIDRSFIAGLGEATDLTALTTTIVRLGHDLGLTLVAEGIESVDQLRRLQGTGCHRGQGFLFSPAVPAEKLRELLVHRGGLLVGPAPAYQVS